MYEILRYLRDLEYLIYIVLGSLAVWQLWKFYVAWDELRAAAFGLEKESAQLRLNRSAALLVVLLFLGTTVFGLVSFIIPSMPGVNPIPTPTVDLLATSTPTLQAVSTSEQPLSTVVQPPGNGGLPTGCIENEVMIIYPESNSTVNGIVEVEGTVDIENLGFYKFEISSVDTNNWLTIQAGYLPKVDDVLGFWDTTQLEAGNYFLRLVVVDNQGIPLEPCAVYLYVDANEN